MELLLWICLGIAVFLLLATFLTAFICFYRVFYSPKRRVLGKEEYELPNGKIYEEYREEMIGWVKAARAMPHKDFSVTSFDGLTLRGRYFEYRAGATTELLFHGYRGNAERDLSGGVERCFALGRNALIVDQRASGQSDGHVISFGVNERKDCRTWIDFAIKQFGSDVKLILTGISMGAATVMMAAGEELPANVVCVLADCGYSSQKEIIQKVIREMNLPSKLLYPFVKLGARVFGHFDLDETTPIEAIRKSHVPVIFIHGDTDAFVPCEMSRQLYENCASKHKRFVSVPNAGHGLAYPADKEGYLAALSEFRSECGF